MLSKDRMILVFRTHEAIMECAEFYNGSRGSVVAGLLSAVNPIHLDNKTFYVLIPKFQPNMFKDAETEDFILPTIWHTRAANIFSYVDGEFLKHKCNLDEIGLNVIRDIFDDLKKYDGPVGATMGVNTEEAFDLHRYMASRMFNVDYADVSDEQRRAAKSATYSQQFLDKAKKENLTIDMDAVRKFVAMQERIHSDPTLEITELFEHSRIVIYFGHELYVPHNVEWLAIDENGDVNGFVTKPTYYPGDVGDSGQWLQGTVQEHPVCRVNLGEVKSEETLRHYPIMKRGAIVRGVFSAQGPVQNIPKADK